MEETYTQQALTMAKGSSILIDGHPCKVRSVEYIGDRQSNEYTCKFDAYDIFDLSTHQTQARATELITCPHVRDNVYRLWRIYDDGKMRVQSCLDGTWGYMTLPMPNLLPHPHVPNADGKPDPNPNATFVAHYKRKISMGRKLFLDVQYVMGREHIVGIKEQLVNPPPPSKSLDEEED